MNYILAIKEFQGFAQDKRLSSGQIALWYALMYINNRASWQEWFTVANLSLELNSGLSRQGIMKARNVLRQFGLIDFKSNGTRATSYKIITTSKSIQVGIQDGVQDGIQVGIQDGVQSSSTLNKQNKTKLNKTKDIPPLSPKGKLSKKTRLISIVDDSELSESLKVSLGEWLEYKKFEYQPIGLTKLIAQINNQPYSENQIIHAVDVSIARGYKGIIFNLAAENHNTAPNSANAIDWERV